MGLIALMGRSKSGKDTIGEMIQDAMPAQVVRMAFADKLKQVCMDLFGLSHDDVYTEEGKDRASRIQGLTNRGILKRVADEVRRVDDSVFVNFTMRTAHAMLRQHPETTVVITDCRFVIEAEAVWLAGGQVWRIRRPDTDGQRQGIIGHASETEMDTIPEGLFKHVIVNDGTLNNLRTRVMGALAV